jgi:nucleoside-diphosphate-sugar epimerase
MLEHLNVSSIAPQRAVVMGATGFVGGAVAARLVRDGVPVLALGRRDVDLLAPDAAERLAALLRPGDAFVAVSARAPVKNADMLVENLIMARAMARALADRPVAHVVNVSSDAIYADSDAPLTEDSCASPGSLHGVMHLARELMFRAEVKAPLATVRPTLIYGPGDPHNGYGPNKFRRLAAKGEDIVLFGEGEECRDHVYIDDVAALIARVIFRRSTGSLNIATGEVHSFRDIAEQVARLSGKPFSIRRSPRVGPIPHNGYRPFDITACRAAFPNFEFTTLGHGLALSKNE